MFCKKKMYSKNKFERGSGIFHQGSVIYKRLRTADIPNIGSEICCDNVNKHKLFIIIRRIMLSRVACGGVPITQK
jgi:hypothetical protein